MSDEHPAADYPCIGDKVVALDFGIKANRANTFRSSEYDRLASRLPPLKARRLAILESHFFESRSTLVDCRNGEMNVPHGKFECGLGYIAFYYSRPKRKFCLLDFGFGDGGTGGLPVPAGDHPDAARARLRRCAVTRHRVAMFLSALFAAGTSLARGFGRHVRPAGQMPYSERVGVRSAAGRKCGPGSGMPGLPVAAGADGGVPHSILTEFLMTPRQLGNPYARSILAGEALCRTALDSEFGRTLLLRAKYRGEGSARLLVESAFVLDVMFAGKAVPDTRIILLRVADALKDSLLADDRLFPIVRGELTAHLSIHVARQATLYLGRRSDGTNHRRALRLMKKYSLLADFACLAMRIPSCDMYDGSFEGVLGDCGRGLRGRALTGAFAAFGSFDSCVHLVLADVSADRDRRTEANDMPSLHRRALDVARELLGSPDE